MNYAQDALFWYLYNPQVRALATLLTAPAPIIYENEISVKELLGENGFRFLKQLDDNPQLLLNHLQATQDIKNYAEQLWYFWLNHSPNKETLRQKEIQFCFDYYSRFTAKAVKAVSRRQYIPIRQGEPTPNDFAVNRLYNEKNFSGSLNNKTLTRGLVYVQENSDLTAFSPTAWLCPVISRLPEIAANERWITLNFQEHIAPALREKIDTFSPPKTSTLLALVAQNPDGLWREKERFYFQAA